MIERNERIGGLKSSNVAKLNNLFRLEAKKKKNDRLSDNFVENLIENKFTDLSIHRCIVEGGNGMRVNYQEQVSKIKIRT